MQFSLYDASNPAASPEETYQKFKAVVRAADDEDELSRANTNELEDNETSEETDDQGKSEGVEKQKRKLRIARLKRKSIAARAYQFSGAGNGISGIVFLEISRIKDLPPERNGM